MNKAWLTGLLAVLLFAAFSLYITRNKAPDPTPQSEIFNNQIAAFDFDGQHSSVTNQQLYNGDALMFLKVGDNRQMYFFSSFAEFQAYDPGHSGFIALNNPDFSQYYLGRYVADSRTLLYQSLQKSGVSGITLTYNEAGEAIAAQAIMTDNSRRNIDMVPINDSFLLLATLAPVKTGS